MVVVADVVTGGAGQADIVGAVADDLVARLEAGGDFNEVSVALAGREDAPLEMLVVEGDVDDVQALLFDEGGGGDGQDVSVVVAVEVGA